MIFSRIKDRSTVRARPTGIPTPGKKPAVHQKPKIDRNNQVNAVEDPVVVEKNQKNQQKSGLKAPVKSLIRQYQGGPKTFSPDSASSPNESKISRSIPKANETSQKSTKPKAPPPPPRSAKPTLVTGSPKTTAGVNGSLCSGVGLGGGSVPHKGFSYLPSSFSSNEENKQTNSDPVNSFTSPSSSPSCANSNKILTTFSNSYSSEDLDKSVENSSENSPMQPRMYAGSSMAAQTQFSSIPQSDSTAPKLLKPKSFESRLRGASFLHKPQVSKSSTVASNDGNETAANVSKAVTESKEMSQTTSTSSLFGLTSRSYKGNQLKPFSIPVVPDVTGLSKSSNSMSIQTTLTNAEMTASIEPDPRNRTSSFSNASLNSDKIPSGDELPEKEKNKPTKKGLFGLRKLVSNKNTNKQNSLKKNQNKEVAVSTPSEVPRKSILSSHSPAGSEASIRSASLSESSPSLQGSRIFKQSVQKSPTVTSRKASIPKTDLLHSLLNHKTDQKEEKVDHSQSRDDNSQSSSVYSDSDKEAGHNTGTPNLTGVLKNSNLVKSTSSSSILTDSGASNLSTTPSIKIKKVSFQDNVTVCDGNVISTFSNSLRHPDIDEKSVPEMGSLEEQSLSHDASEEAVPRDCAVVRPWQSLNQHENPSDGRFPKIHDTPVQPSPGYMQYSNNAYSHNNYTPHVTHQSAVAAAIESISAKPVTSMSSHYQTTTTPAISQRQYGQFSVSCASPVPFITRQDRRESAYREEWDLSKRVGMDTHSIPHGSVLIPQNPAIVSDQGDFLTSSKKNIENSFKTETDLSYFQTQQAPGGLKDQSYSDAPPYYECCTSSTPTNQVTPSQLRENIDPRNESKVAKQMSRNIPNPNYQKVGV